MKPPVLLASVALCLAPLAGCEGGYGTNVALGWSTYPYDGWYDGYYGSIYDGYWARDNFFYFRLRPEDREFRRGDRQHFHRDNPNQPGSSFRRFDGTLRPPPDGTRMPKFPRPNSRRGGYAPQWSGRVTATYTAEVSDKFRLITELSPYFTSSYFTVSGDPIFQVGSYVRLDGRITLESHDGRWAFDIIGKNLTDRTIVAIPGLYTAAKQAPRNIAAQLRVKF